VIPRAVPTVSAVGQLTAAWVVVWLDSGAVLADVAADAVADVVADGVAAALEGDPPLELPQAVRVTLKMSVVSANQRERPCDT
jgi:hypothetical protein